MKKLIGIAFLIFAVFLFFLFLKSGESHPNKPHSSAHWFEGVDYTGKIVRSSDYRGSYVVLEWSNPKCACVGRHYEGYMQALQQELMSTGVVWIIVNSSAKGRDGYLSNQEVEAWLNEKKCRPTAYLRDLDGKIGKSFKAKATPHMVLLDPGGFIVYSGAPDNNTTGSLALMNSATNYLKKALSERMSGLTVSVPSTPAYGCSVKYADPNVVEAVGIQVD